MDELEWLKEHSPSPRPSRDITRRHRTQLRAAIAADGADGTRPRRPRRERRSRYRVLVTTAVVVALCAVGAGIIALTSSGGDESNTVGAPASTDAPATTSVRACAGAPPKELAIPTGFGTGVAVPSSKQQVTRWSSDQATIEQRWPADADKVPDRSGTTAADGFTALSDPSATVDAKGVAHQTVAFVFGGQPTGCDALQITVSGDQVDAVEAITDSLLHAPFRSNEPLVTTTGTATAAPPVVACEGVADADTAKLAVPGAAIVGGGVRSGAFPQPADALAAFLTGKPTLAQRGYQEQWLDDASVVFVKSVRTNVVTTVHVAPTSTGWTATDWAASGC